MLSFREQFTGPLSGLIGRWIPDLQPSFELARGLKAEVARRRTDDQQGA